jgi:hypothetical protein
MLSVGCVFAFPWAAPLPYSIITYHPPPKHGRWQAVRAVLATFHDRGLVQKRKDGQLIGRGGAWVGSAIAAGERATVPSDRGEGFYNCSI